MEKYIKNINTPCIVSVNVNANGASISTHLKKDGYKDDFYKLNEDIFSVDEKSNLNISCNDEKTVKLIINYVPAETRNEIKSRDFSVDRRWYGGTDNWGDFSDYEESNKENHEKIKAFLDDESNIGWEYDPETTNGFFKETTLYVISKNKEAILPEEKTTSLEGQKREYVTKKFQEPIVIDYYKDSSTIDSIFVNINNVKIERLLPETTPGKYDWCECIKTKDEYLKYNSITSNPTNKPRFAYFKFTTSDKTMNKGPKTGCYVLPEWIVTVIQLPNPNVLDKDVELPDLGGFLYKVGLISDVHFDADDIYGKQYMSDLSNALDYFKSQNVKFISCAGDLCNYVDNNYEYDLNDLNKFNEIYSKYGYDKSKQKHIRLYNCLGNTDYMKLYSEGYSDKIYNEITYFNLNHIYKDIKYFEYNGEWNKQYVGERTNKSKTSYYITCKHDNNKVDEDIYVYLSVDYGYHTNVTINQLTRACNKLDYNDKYVKQLIPIAKEAGYDYDIDGKFDYQFYDSNSLIWLKDIIENNLDKHIFVFMHHGLPHKAGNGTSYNDGFTYNSYNRIFPYDYHHTILKDIERSGSNTLCGLQFYFLNWLNNTYKHVIWFSGHTHYSWESGDSTYVNQFSGDQYLNFCNRDFNIYKPTGNEYYNNPANSKSISIDYKPRIYTRIPLALPVKSDNKLSEMYVDNPIDTSAWNIHLPSLSQPSTRIKDNVMYKSSEGALMEVYQNGIRIRELLFKHEDSQQYINYIIKDKLILFEQ